MLIRHCSSSYIETIVFQRLAWCLLEGGQIPGNSSSFGLPVFIDSLTAREIPAALWGARHEPFQHRSELRFETPYAHEHGSRRFPAVQRLRMEPDLAAGTTVGRRIADRDRRHLGAEARRRGKRAIRSDRSDCGERR